MTNLKDWVFTHYSVLKEAGQIIESKGDFHRVRNLQPFEHSEVFRIFKVDPRTKAEVIDIHELQRLCLVIEFLYAVKE